MKSIILLCYNRPKKVKECLNALKSAYSIESYELIVSQQIDSSKETQDVTDLISSINWIKVHHRLYKPKKEDSISTKITSNKYNGFSYAFETLQSDFCIFIEDDSVIGFDFLYFCEIMITKYQNDPFFRAVCSFSIESKSDSNLYTYSKFRFGIGQAYGITRKHWFSIFKPSWPKKKNILFDVHIETTIKTGYIILPAASRLKDIGIGPDASFAVSSKNDYVNKNIKSFVGTSSFEIKDYIFDKKLPFHWRQDCIHFSWLSPITYALFRFARKTLSLIFRKDITQILPSFLIKRFVNVTHKN
tara:strand:+ start:2041 stop:2946 length:906 start_codon:yes stop_codon:yes gene_type:complete